jgi:hypothetical protein
VDCLTITGDVALSSFVNGEAERFCACTCPPRIATAVH